MSNRDDRSYFDLSRRYVEMSPNEKFNEEGSRLFPYFDNHSGISLAQLLDKQRVAVVLAEARSGKTTEFKQAEARIRNDGKTAFFIQLEELANGFSVAKAIDNSLDDAYESWLTSSDNAVFFLDAVDEAKLSRIANLETSLKQLGRELRHQLHRATFCFSSRHSEWRKADWESVNSFAKQLPDTPTAAVFRLAPLDEQRIKYLAKEYGLQKANEFFTYSDLEHLWELLCRPGDALEMFKAWQAGNGLGAITEIMEHMATRGLAEHNNRHHVQTRLLTSAQARSAAETLAAAAVLCNSPRFVAASAERDERVSLDAKILLPSFNEQQVASLLSRSLFDIATMGHVRFHHRDIKDYLAASWLRELYENNDCGPELCDLFFREVHGRITVIPSRAGAMAWLAPHVPDVLRKAIEHAPEMLVDLGDPGQLNDEQRFKVLTAYAAKYSGIGHSGNRFDWAGLRRFVCPSLAPTINSMLANASISQEAKRLLLKLVRVGGLNACSQATRVIALASEDWLAVKALKALQEADTKEDLEALAEAYPSFQNVKNANFAAVLFDTLHPQLYPIDKFISRLAEIPPQLFVETGSISQCIHDVVANKIINESSISQLDGFLTLLAQNEMLPFYTNAIAATVKTTVNLAMIDFLYIALSQRLELSSEYPVWLIKILSILQLQNVPKEFHAKTSWEAIQTSVSNAPTGVRRQIFHLTVEAFHSQAQRSEDKLRPSDIRFAQGRGLLVPREEDFEWLLQEASAPGPRHFRIIALRALFRVRSWEAVLPEQERIMGAVADDDSLLKEARRWFSPPKRSEEDLKWERIHNARVAKEKANHDKFVSQVLSNIHAIEEASDINLMCELLDFTDSAQSNLSENAASKIAKEISPQAATAMESGSIQYWMRTQLQRHFGYSEWYCRDVLLLFGLGCAVRANPTMNGYSDELIRKAIADGLCDLNFPKWLAELCAAHPAIAGEVLLDHLQSVIQATDSQDLHAPQLSKDIARSEPLRQIIGRQLLDLAERYANEKSWVHEFIQQLLPDRALCERIAVIAKEQFLAGTKDSEAWFDIWLLSDVEPAWNEFQKWLDGESDKDSAVLGFAGRHNDFGTTTRGVFLARCVESCNVRVLHELILLLYKHIRPEEDIYREGSYSPGLRDDAQQFRDNALSALAKIAGDESSAALGELRNSISHPPTQDTIANVIEEKLRRESEFPMSSEQEFLAFAKDVALVPKTADDLFKLALRTLEHLKADIEAGDYSPRGLPLFAPETDEYDVQLFLANRIKEKAKERYCIVREPEVSSQKRVDIRFLVPGIGPVNIEIKCAHKWTTSQLEDALKLQLVGQYMKSYESRHGILLLINAKGQRQWRKKDGTNIDFQDLVTFLDALAKEMRDNNPNSIRGLRVLGIDASQ